MKRYTWLIAVVVAALAQEGGNEIFSPPAGSSWGKGKVRLVARVAAGAKPMIDGKPVTVESPFRDVLKADLEVGPGAHELTLGDQKAPFFVGPGGGGEFRPFKDHPPMQAGCDTCHAVRNDAWRFKRLSLTAVCSQCHAKDTFVAKHTHEMGILPDCQMCHTPHGGTTAGFLKMSKEKACKQCHS
jgi:predicted CXXCH cytochrome family protein